ncbi:protein-methionine-sulfoxide reductase heme-binding subunit MsrQ [Teredinibacter sp. KSP-S5-2]|uniref:protein-methionine-sulfoxide reductase heme-binding subunit MsrQ n=1 Tax=Teredinibacter sp. KSP-S5-2 TaxID=3034506 RepID=UPI00293445FB|nr:protein-methionine-sulfoxide reductase heme-binding subunit MsrQ [Teredinibacter sp. KSP-S5-2]WNO08414.1 protein-methionine-sulfoxide reductase heme-binding subunit MsrQ [Teredinibacter sp. KSP-S5-2]
MFSFISTVILHFIIASPLVVMFYRGVMDQLGADPVKALIHFSGISTLNLLVITLSVTPLARWFRWGWLVRQRKTIGLYCFAYASAHIFSYLGFELGFAWQDFVSEIVKRPYITLGALAYVMLVVLAITSLDYIKKIIGSRWKSIHQMIYLIVILGGIHFLWSVKSDIVEPLVYLSIFSVLLFLRRDKLRKIWCKWFVPANP